MNNVDNLVTDPITGQQVNTQVSQQNAAVYNNPNAMATGQAVLVTLRRVKTAWLMLIL